MESGYVKRTTKIGNYIEEKKYYTPRYPGQHIPRRGNYSETTEEQWKVNERNSIEKLRLLILGNFGRDDIWLGLTHEGAAPDLKEAKRDFDNFVTRLRRAYRARGHELKWVASMESDGHRVHHHMLLNNIGLTRKDLERIWGLGKIPRRACQPYDGGTEDAKNVAHYLVKESRDTYNQAGSLQKQRWRASRNLERPVVKKQVIHSKSWKEQPRPKKGYYIESVQNGYDTAGRPFQFYRMVKEGYSVSDQEKEGRNVYHPKSTGAVPSHHRRAGKHALGP